MKEFVNGLTVKAPFDSAPSYVKCKLSIKRQELIEWLESKNENWINIDINESSRGTWYAQVNDWKPNN